MDDAVTARYRFTADELLRAQRWSQRHRMPKYMRLTYWPVMTAFVVTVGAMAVSGNETAMANAVLPLLLIFGVPLILPWLGRRQIARRSDLGQEAEWTIWHDRLRCCSDLATSEYVWAAVVEVVQTRDGFLVYTTPAVFQWLPRHAFANEADYAACARMAREHARKFTEFA